MFRKEKGLVHKVKVNRRKFGQVSEFNYLEIVLEEFGPDGAESYRQVVSGRKVEDSAVMPLLNTRGVRLDCARVLHGNLLT